MSRTRSCRSLLSASALLAVLGLASCSTESPEEPPDYRSAPVTIGSPAAAADVDQLLLPYQLEDHPVLDPGWDTPPYQAEGTFLAPGGSEGILTFTALDTDGTILWQAERPLSCAGFTLTHDGTQDLVVLTDLDPDQGSFGTPTASAYDLETGEQVWGPVGLPGPHQGPGLVFAEPPEEHFGDLGPKVVLDPATGEVVAEEAGEVGETGEEAGEAGTRVLGEHRGTILLAEEEQIRAYTQPDGEPEWSLALADHGWELEEVFSQAPSGPGSEAMTLLGAPDDQVLLDLSSGQVIAEGLRDAAHDPTSRTWITLGDELAGYDEAGSRLFSRADAEGLQIDGAGGVMVYLRTEDDRIQVHNAVTGELARAYDPEGEGALAVPAVINEFGAAVLSTEDRHLFAPVDTEAHGPSDG